MSAAAFLIPISLQRHASGVSMAVITTCAVIVSLISDWMSSPSFLSLLLLHLLIYSRLLLLSLLHLFFPLLNPILLFILNPITFPTPLSIPPPNRQRLPLNAQPHLLKSSKNTETEQQGCRQTAQW